jgi:hypothetical protein
MEHGHDHDGNPFFLNQPDQLSHIEVPDTSCPFNQVQLQEFWRHLRPLLERTQSRRLLWIEALAIAVVTTQTLV